MATVNEVLQSILAELKNVSQRVTNLESRLNRLEGSPMPERTLPTSSFTRSMPLPDIPPAPQPAQASAGVAFETKIGIEWLGKIGIIAIAIAMAYLLKYTIVNSLFGLSIGPVGRILIGFAVGIGMLLFGEFFNSRYPQWSKEFTGGGLGLLYFAIFTASNWELTPFIPYSAGLVLMSVVSAAAAWFSIRYNSKIIAYFGLAGAYLTPLLIGYQMPSYNRMLFYILVLDIAVCFFAFFRNWRLLNAIAFLATIIYSAPAYYSDNLSFGLSLSYLIIFFILFITLPVLYNLMYRERTKQEDLVILLLNPVITMGHFYALFNMQHYDNYLGLISLAFAALYLCLAYFAFAVNRDDKNLSLSFVGLTAAFVAIAIPLQLHTYWMTVSWAMQFIVMLWIGLHLRQHGTRFYALIVGVIALIRLFFVDISSTTRDYLTLFWNPRVMTSLFVIALIYVGAYLYKHYRTQIKIEERDMVAALVVIANALTVYLFSLEIYLHDSIAQARAIMQTQNTAAAYTAFGFRVHLLVSTFWLVYATSLLIVGIIKKYRSIRVLALLMYLLSIIKIVIFDLSGFEAIYRIMAFIILGIMLIFASYMYTRNKEQILKFIKRDAEEDITSTILSMSDDGKKEVIFTLLDGQRFKVANTNIVKICLATRTRYGKSQFQPNELAETYELYEKNFHSQLNPADLAMIKQYLKQFVTVGGSFEIN